MFGTCCAKSPEFEDEVFGCVDHGLFVLRFGN